MSDLVLKLGAKVELLCPEPETLSILWVSPPSNCSSKSELLHSLASVDFELLSLLFQGYL